MSLKSPLEMSDSYDPKNSDFSDENPYFLTSNPLHHYHEERQGSLSPRSKALRDNSIMNKSFFRDTQTSTYMMTRESMEARGDIAECKIIPQGVVSRANLYYFCDVNNMAIVKKIDMSQEIHVFFCAQGDCSQGAIPNPLCSKLSINGSIFFPSVQTRKSYTSHQTFHQIIGVLVYDIGTLENMAKISFEYNSDTTPRFLGDETRLDKNPLKYSAVYLNTAPDTSKSRAQYCHCGGDLEACKSQSKGQSPQSNRRLNHPSKAKSGIWTTPPTINAIADTQTDDEDLFECFNCNFPKHGYHWKCSSCNHSYCYECLSAPRYSSLVCNNDDCEGRKGLKSAFDFNHYTDKAIRCGNCGILITRNVLTSINTKRCVNCHYTLCKSCCFDNNAPSWLYLELPDIFPEGVEYVVSTETNGIPITCVDIRSFFMISGHINGYATIWNLESGYIERQINCRYRPIQVKLILGKSNNILACTVGANNILDLWDFNDQSSTPLSIVDQPIKSLNGHESKIHGIVSISSFKLSNKLLNDRSKSTRSIRSYIGMKAIEKTIDKQRNPSKESSDGVQIANILLSIDDMTARVWNLNTALEINQLQIKAKEGQFTCLVDASIQDSYRVIIGRVHGASMYDISTSEIIATYRSDDLDIINQLKVTSSGPSNSNILIGASCGYKGSRMAYLWDLISATRLRKISAPSTILNICVVELDNLLAAGCVKGQLPVWNTNGLLSEEPNRFGIEVEDTPIQFMAAYAHIFKQYDMGSVRDIYSVFVTPDEYDNSKIRFSKLPSTKNSSSMPTLDAAAPVDISNTRELRSIISFKQESNKSDIISVAYGLIQNEYHVMVICTPMKFSLIDLTTGAILLERYFDFMECEVVCVQDNKHREGDVNQMQSDLSIICALKYTKATKIYYKYVKWSATTGRITFIRQWQGIILNMISFTPAKINDSYVIIYELKNNIQYVSFWDCNNNCCKRVIIQREEISVDKNRLFYVARIKDQNNLVIQTKPHELHVITFTDDLDILSLKDIDISSLFVSEKMPEIAKLVPYQSNIRLSLILISTNQTFHQLDLDEKYYHQSHIESLSKELENLKSNQQILFDCDENNFNYLIYEADSMRRPNSSGGIMKGENWESTLITYNFDEGQSKILEKLNYTHEKYPQYMKIITIEKNGRSTLIPAVILGFKGGIIRIYNFHLEKDENSYITNLAFVEQTKRKLLSSHYTNNRTRSYTNDGIQEQNILKINSPQTKISDLSLDDSFKTDPTYKRSFDTISMKAYSSTKTMVTSPRKGFIGGPSKLDSLDVYWLQWMNAEVGVNILRDNQFWTYHQDILFDAVEDGYVDFIRVVSPLLQRNEVLLNRCLYIAVTCRQNGIIKVLMQIWLETLNNYLSMESAIYDDDKAELSIRNKYWFHWQSALLAPSTLIYLSKSDSKDIVVELRNFIRSIKMLPTLIDMHELNELLASINTRKLELEGAYDTRSSWIDIWKRKLLGKKSSYGQGTDEDNEARPSAIETREIVPFVGKQYEACFLPLRHCASLEMIDAYVNISIKLNDTKIFESELCKIAMRYAWRSYGKNVHIKAAIQYIIFLILFTLYIYNYTRWRYSNYTITRMILFLIEIVNIVYLYYFGFLKFRKLRSQLNDDGNINHRFYHRNVTESKYEISNITNIERMLSFSVYTYLFDGVEYQHYETFSKRWLYRLFIVLSIYIPSVVVVYIIKFIIVMIFVLPIKIVSISKDQNISTNFFKKEIPIIMAYFKVLSRFIANIWNFIDVALIISGFLGILARVRYEQDSDASRGLLAIGAVCSWFKVLFYLRPFASSGPLVAMLLQMAYDIRFFIFILVVVLAGFAEAFWILSHHSSKSEDDNYDDDKYQYASVEESIKNIFYSMISGFSSATSFRYLPRLGFTLVLLFSFIVTILMLNLLIALMTKTFDKIKEHNEAQWGYEQATIMLEEDYRMKSTCPPYVHILRQKHAPPMEPGTKDLEHLKDEMRNLQIKMDSVLSALETVTLNSVRMRRTPTMDGSQSGDSIMS